MTLLSLAPALHTPHSSLHFLVNTPDREQRTENREYSTVQCSDQTCKCPQNNGDQSILTNLFHSRIEACLSCTWVLLVAPAQNPKTYERGVNEEFQRQTSNNTQFPLGQVTWLMCQCFRPDTDVAPKTLTLTQPQEQHHKQESVACWAQNDNDNK